MPHSPTIRSFLPGNRRTIRTTRAELNFTAKLPGVFTSRAVMRKAIARRAQSLRPSIGRVYTWVWKLRSVSAKEEITVTAIPAATYREYLSSLLGGDRVASAEIVNQTLSQGTPMRWVHLDLFEASLYEVGERWATNQISVASEHLATAVTEGLLNELYPRLPCAGRGGKTVIVAGLQPELHQVGGKIVADTFEMHGWDSRYLGANVPADELRRSPH